MDFMDGYAHKPKSVNPFVAAMNNGGGFTPGHIHQAVKAKDAWVLFEGGGEDAGVDVP